MREHVVLAAFGSQGRRAGWIAVALGVMFAFVTFAFVPGVSQARVWTDSTGHYSLEAELVAFNDKTVVLQRGDHELGAVAIEQLSAKDREYLMSEEAAKAANQAAETQQVWTKADGTKIVGQVVDFARREVTIQRRRGRMYVNDRRFENLPDFYQQMLPEVVNHFENLPRADRRGLEAWLLQQRGQPRSFVVEGVVLELAGGDEYAVPFFLLSAEDQKVLKPGWEKWLAAHQEKNYDSQEDLAFLLRSLAAAKKRDLQVQREIALMQLHLQAVQAGLTSLWEVTLYPAVGQGGPPLWVVIPGRDSQQATIAALQHNPGFVAGAVRRVSR